MRKEAALPGKHTFPFLLRACTKYHSLSSGIQLHGHVIKHGFDLDLNVVNGLIRFYGIWGSILDARRVFDGSPERTFVLLTDCIDLFHFKNLKAMDGFNTFHSFP